MRTGGVKYLVCPRCLIADIREVGMMYACNECGEFFEFPEEVSVTQDCPHCSARDVESDGATNDGLARFTCPDCGGRFIEITRDLLSGF